MSRHNRILDALEIYRTNGIVRSWYCCAPGDSGKRWVVETRIGTRSLSTREVECFIFGLEANARSMIA